MKGSTLLIIVALALGGCERAPKTASAPTWRSD